MTRVRCGGLIFISDFDSGNLAKVETVTTVPKKDLTDNSTGSTSSSSHGRSTHVATGGTKSSKLQVKGEHPFSPRSRVKGVHASKQVATSDTTKNKASPKDKTKSSLFNDSKSATKKSTPRKGFEKILEFKVWTKPDCAGTPYENGNRTWFHFGVEGGPSGSVIKIHVMNLNRQGKLYCHGMTPVFKIVPAKEGWKRVPGKVKYKNSNDGNFIITFSHPFPSNPDAIIYFAFAYPFSYSECQQMLDDIDGKIGSSLYHSMSDDEDESSPDSVYYCREVLCHSLDGLKVELLTVSSFKGLTSDREPRLPNLFPDDSRPRCHVFRGKKVVFISGRVHPGETPSSFVFNGLLHFLLYGQDEKSTQLRHQFVFKLIPMLNPDGVFRGHYRTDTQGLNLNRVYLIANPQQHPSIYAARTLLLHYHVSYSSASSKPVNAPALSVPSEQGSSVQSTEDLSEDMTQSPDLKSRKYMSNSVLALNSEKKSEDTSSLNLEILEGSSSPSEKRVSFDEYVIHLSDDGKEQMSPSQSSEVDSSVVLNSDKTNNDLTSLCSSSYAHGDSKQETHLRPDLGPGDITTKNNSSSESLVNNIWENIQIVHKSLKPDSPPFPMKLLKPHIEKESYKSNSELEASDADEEISASSLLESVSKTKQKRKKLFFQPKMNMPLLSPEESGIAFYVDLHGHASKRGCFLYGNYFVNLDQKVECMLLPKLMSMNCPHFDFSACNFSAQNMYQGGGKEGQSKEGSGRVALYTLTGIIHSYTLECNYNTSRSTVVIPPTESSGNSSWMGNKLPHYTPEIYHQVGRSLLISMLDSFSLSPFSRVVYSSCHSVEGVREWLKKHINTYSTKGSEASLKDRHHSWTAGVSCESLPAPKEKCIVTDSRRATIHYVSPRAKSIAPKLSTGLRGSTKCKKHFISPWDPPLSNRQLLAKFEKDSKISLGLKSSPKLPGLLHGIRISPAGSMTRTLRSEKLSGSSPKPFSKPFMSSQAARRKPEPIKNLSKDLQSKSSRHDRSKDQKSQLPAKSRFAQKSPLIKSGSLEKMAKPLKAKMQPPVQGMKSMKAASSKVKQKFAFPVNKIQDPQVSDMLHKPENLRPRTQLPKNSLNAASSVTQPSSSGRRHAKRQSPTYIYMAFPKAYHKSKTKDKT